MTNPTSKKSQRVRFEEVTPTNEIVAYFNTQLPSLLAGTGLPIFPGYDDLDYIQFAYITLPSGNTVVLGQYENAPEIGVDLYIDFNPKNNLSTIATNIPALIVETLQYLAIPRATAVWFHPDYETEIDRLYSDRSEIEPIARPDLASLSPNEEREPIDCFYYALHIYTRKKLPEYWAMLQHNLGLAYFDRIKDERWRNLQKSIECFNNSLEVFTHDKFPRRWQINDEDLDRSRNARNIEIQKLISDILNRPIKNRDLKDIYLVNIDLNLKGACLINADLTNAFMVNAVLCNANLSNAKLRHAKLQNTNLCNAELTNSDLHCADLSSPHVVSFYTNLSGANLINANLSNTNLYRVDISNANLSNANLSGAILIFANLSNAKLNHANLEGVIIRRPDIHSANDTIGAQLGGADLSDANLTNVDLTRSCLNDAILIRANLIGTDFRGADLLNANLDFAVVNKAKFGNNKGISESMRQDLLSRGAIFEDSPGDRSESQTLVPR
jgi:uncharacterized protein YjbI with pentapeptide repeats